MRPLTILFTNVRLAERTGTELWVKEAAVGLLRRGHRPVAYSPQLGEVAEEIRAATVPVVSDLAQVGCVPDVIHGHHHQQTMAALLRFPEVPALYVVHDWIAWHDTPPRFPRIRRYLAVDGTNRDRLVAEHGHRPDAVRVLANWVDLERFRPRPPLPARPRRALVFSNEARADTHLPAIVEACARAGLELDVLGAGVGRSHASPETVLGNYEVVFAKARAALEALAVGAAVVLCDTAGLGPMVTRAQLEELRWLNLGRRALARPVTANGVLAELLRYDAADATAVASRVRETAGLADALDRLEALYEEVIDAQAAAPSPAADELRAASAYLQTWAGPRPLEFDRTAAAAETELLRRRLEQRERELEWSRATVPAGLAAAVAAEPPSPDADAPLVRLRQERDGLAAELKLVRSTAAWRLRGALIRARPVAALYRLGKRLIAGTGSAASQRTGSQPPRPPHRG